MPRIIDQVHLTQKIEFSGEKHASKTPIDKDKNQDDCFQPSEISELRQPYAPVGVVNETLDKIFSNKRKQTGSRSLYGDRTYQEHPETKF